MKMFRKDEGFTLVELMVVVLIIGILVAIAVPVFLNASANASAKSCQASQRTIVGAIQTYNASADSASQITSETAGGAATVLGSGNGNPYAPLFDANTGTLKSVPVCPIGKSASGQYVMQGASVIGDKSNGTTVASGFVNENSTNSHKLGQ